MRLDQKDEQQIFGNVARLTDQLMQAHVTLYSIDPLGANESVGRTLYYQAFLKGLSKPDQAQLGNLGLQVLAIQSGGLALSSTDVAGRLRKCLQDSVPYYEISYDAPAARQPNEYHHVEVKLDKHDLTARTREGYYAQP
jgi:VWFA-related protein